MPAQGLLVLAPMPPLPGFVPCRRTGRRPHHPAPVVYTIARRILEATKVGRPYPSSDAAQVGEARSGGPGQLRDWARQPPGCELDHDHCDISKTVLPKNRPEARALIWCSRVLREGNFAEYRKDAYPTSPDARARCE